jgi:hypothetical protein
MTRVLCCLFVFIFFSRNNFAQKQTEHVQQVWVAYANQTRFSDHWGLWADFHLRTKEAFLTDLSQAIARLGLTYYVNDKVKLTAGYAYVNIFPAEGHTNVSQPEHRPWQQVQWHTNSKKMKIMQWLRLEERYRHKIKSNDELADGYNFNYRVRYNYLMMFPLGKRAFQKNAVSAVINNELHINFGKEVILNTFDQNRFFAGFAYHVNENDNIQFGYMNLYQQMAAGNKYRMIHVPRIYYFHNIDLRKKT